MNRSGVQFARRAAGLDQQQTALQDAVWSAFASVLPQWVRGSRQCEPVDIAAATAFYVPHLLGHAHTGWIVTRLVSASNDAGVVEIQESDGAYKSGLASTHLQLRGNRAARVWLVVF